MLSKSQRSTSTLVYQLASNLIEIQGIETATYSNMGYFPGEHYRGRESDSNKNA